MLNRIKQNNKQISRGARHGIGGRASGKYAALGRFLEATHDYEAPMSNNENAYCHSCIVILSSLVIFSLGLSRMVRQLMTFQNRSRFVLPALGQMPQLDIYAPGEIQVSTQFHAHRHVPMIPADARVTLRVLFEVVHYRVPSHLLLIPLRMTSRMGSRFINPISRSKISP